MACIHGQCEERKARRALVVLLADKGWEGPVKGRNTLLTMTLRGEQRQVANASTEEYKLG